MGFMGYVLGIILMGYDMSWNIVIHKKHAEKQNAPVLIRMLPISIFFVE